MTPNRSTKTNWPRSRRAASTAPLDRSIFPCSRMAYARNMATGASTADLAVILVDATKGILPQTRRHAFIASLLGIRDVLAAVNKMDLVNYREDEFLQLEQDFLKLAAQLGIARTQCVPISALEGDNVVDRSPRTYWYQGQ